MIKNNQHIFNKIQVLADAGIIAVSYALSWYLRFHSSVFPPSPGGLPAEVYMSALIFVVPVYLILYSLFQLYMPRRMQSRRRELLNIVRANVIGFMGFILVLYFTKQEHFSRQMLALFLIVNVTLEWLSRNLIRYVLWKIRSQGFNQKHILLVGNSRAAKQYQEKIRQNPRWGYHVLGVLDDIGKLEETIREHELDEIVITLRMSEYEKLEKVVDICEKSGVHTKFIPDYGNLIPTRPYIEDVQGIPVINIRRVPLNLVWNQFMKRGVDIAGALLAIVVFSPVMLITAISLKAVGNGSVIYKQERVGMHNKKFWMYKFRSMIEQDEMREKSEWTVKDDPRVTPIGRFIRKMSIDELPQLFNVLKGEMSLVGPRPERPQFVEKFKNEIPRYMVKHQVRPGMTGWAQIHGYRGDTSIEKRIEYDLYYIENWSLGLDLKILCMTLFKGMEH